MPLTMPITRRMRSPASDSRSGRMSGMPPADRRLEQDVDARALGGLEQLAPVRGEQLLVGGDDRLAAHQRLDDQRAGRLDAADDLDDDVDVGIADHRARRRR